LGFIPTSAGIVRHKHINLAEARSKHCRTRVGDLSAIARAIVNPLKPKSHTNLKVMSGKMKCAGGVLPFDPYQKSLSMGIIKKSITVWEWDEFILITMGFIQMLITMG